MSSASTVLKELMAGVAAIDAGPRAKESFIALIRAVGAAHGHSAVAREDRVRFARDLLRLRVSRPTIRDRLIATYGLSRPQAYRILNKAFALDHIAPKNETKRLSNECIDNRGGNHE